MSFPWVKQKKCNSRWGEKDKETARNDCLWFGHRVVLSEEEFSNITLDLIKFYQFNNKDLKVCDNGRDFLVPCPELSFIYWFSALNRIKLSVNEFSTNKQINWTCSLAFPADPGTRVFRQRHGTAGVAEPGLWANASAATARIEEQFLHVGPGRWQ